MRAAQFSSYGGPEVLEVVEVEAPTISEDQVLVRVHASSINPFDTTIRSGAMKDAIPLQLPVTLGSDIAGEIIELGENVEGFSVGDKVYGQANVVAGNSGAFAEMVAVKAGSIAKMPTDLSFEEAASLPLVTQSALQGLVEHIDLQPGQKLFIHGGGGGIGSVAIQMAKNIGAYVATTASSEQMDFVKGLGAEEVIDYKQEDFAEKLSDYDAVFDTVGKDDFVKTFKILKKGGVAVSMIAPPNEVVASEAGITAMMQQTKGSTQKLDKIRELVESGVITPHVDKVFTLDDVQAAFESKENGVVNGKIVLKIA